jgi:hypothetical protein
VHRESAIPEAVEDFVQGDPRALELRIEVLAMVRMVKWLLCIT